MRAAFAILERAAPTDVTMLVTGESGTGKELAARALHQSSPRRDGPYIVFDCGAVTPTLIESQLFGHVRGAFTGATDAREGVFEQADGGTLVFDELGELPLGLQPKLLRAIDSRTIMRVGDGKTRKVDVRIIALTNRNLEEEVKEGRFREDLFYRLSVVRVRLPPLRERPEELPRLVRKFLSARGIADAEGMPPATLALLRAHAWPGNVRELRNVVERFAIMPDLDPSFWMSSDLAPMPQGSVAPTVNLDDGFHDGKRRCIDGFERQYLSRLVEEHGDNASEAARVAGLSRQSYYRLLSKHGLRTD
jgi:DNA-binding NtrC family response regulator